MLLSVVGLITATAFGAFEIVGLQKQSVFGFLQAFSMAFFFMLFGFIFLFYERITTEQDILTNIAFYICLVSFFYFLKLYINAKKDDENVKKKYWEGV